MTNIAERPLNELHPQCQNFLDSFGGFNADDVLLAYQKRWIADDSQIKVGEKSRRIGLTWAEAADNALDASTSRVAGGCDTFYIGSNKEMAREYIDAIAMWAKAYNYAASETQEEVFEDEDKDIQVFVIYFASGFKVKALSSSPKNLRGMQGNVVIDEAAHHERFAEVLKAALALTMWGNKVRIISTHNGTDNPFNDYILACRAGKKRGKVHTTTIEDACNDGLYQRICQVVGHCQVTGGDWTPEGEEQWIENLVNDTESKDDALEEYYCVPKSGGGKWLSRAMIEKNQSADTPIIRLTKDKDFSLMPEPLRHDEIQDWFDETLLPILQALDKRHCHSLGEDFARNGDLTSFSIGAEQQDTRLEVQLIVELANMPFKQQEQILMFILKHLPRFNAASLDARGNGQYLAECAFDEYGERINVVMLSEKWYRENTPAFKAALEDGELYGIPKDKDVLADLRSFEVIKGVARIPTARTNTQDNKDGNNSNKRHGDTAISLLLLHHASRSEKPTETGVAVEGGDDDNYGRDTSEGYIAEMGYAHGMIGEHSVSVGMLKGF